MGNEFENASASASAIDIINSKKYQTENGFDIRDDISIKNKSFQIVLEKKNSENDGKFIYIYVKYICINIFIKYI